MVNNEILSFVKEQLSQGKSKDEIRDMLVTHGGWDNKDVDEAFDSLELSGKVMPPQTGMSQPKAEPVSPAPPSSSFSFTPREPAKSMQPTVGSVSADRELASFEKKEPASPLSVSGAPKTSPELQSLGNTPTQNGGVSVLSELRNKFGASEKNAPVVAPASFMSPKTAAPISSAVPPVNPPQQPTTLAAQPKATFTTPGSPIFRPASMEVKSPSAMFTPEAAGKDEKEAPPPIPAENQYFATSISTMKPEIKPAPKTELMPELKQAAKISVSSPVNSGESPLAQKQPAPLFTQVQKLNISPIDSNPAHRSKIPKGEPAGRKTLGTVMFLTGAIIGSVAMHAFLSGYLDSVIGLLGIK